MVAPMKPPQIADEYKLTEVLDAAQEELQKLTAEYARIERRMTKLQGDIAHLAALCGVEVEDPIKQLGLTDAVRYIFGRENRKLSRSQVVDILEQSYDVSGYKNLPANVHTVVRRLLKSKEIKIMDESGGIGGLIGRIGDQETYVWSGIMPLPPPPLPKRPETNQFFLADLPEIESANIGRKIKKEFIKP